MKVQNKNTAIVLAAGQGKRMNSKVAKQYLLLRDKPILYYSLRIFQDSPIIEHIVLVVGAGEVEYVRREIVEKYGFTKVHSIVEGGRERYVSVYHGLSAAAKQWSADWEYCFIHDGARPFVSEAILKRALEAVKQENACVVGMPVKDTIKIADEEAFAQTTPKRSLVWMVQTPQVFAADLIYKAYTRLMEQEEQLLAQGYQITDDAGVVELLTCQKVKLVEGSYENIKITTPEDLKIAETFLN